MLSHFSHIQFFMTLWAVALQDPLSLGFSRQEYWSGLPCPPPGDLPDPGMELASLYISCIGRFFTPAANWEPPVPAIQQCKSAIITHISPPSGASLPTPIPLGSHGAPGWAPCWFI